MTAKVIPLIAALLLSACLYKTPVNQGNILDQEEVNEIKPGMNKRQIAIILGTPAIADPFDQDRWDYVHTIKNHGEFKRVKKLTLFFEDDKLVRTEGNYFPEEKDGL